MDVKALTREILALPDSEREVLAQAVLPVLLTTSAGLAGIDQALHALPDAELERLVERARSRDVTDATVAEVIREALRAVRAESRS